MSGSGSISLRPRVRSGWALKRLDARGGDRALRPARPARRRLRAALRRRRRRCSGCSTAAHPSRAGRAGRGAFGSAGPGGAGAAAGRSRRARPAARQRGRRRGPGGPEAASCAGWCARACGRRRRFGGFVERLYARGGWVLFLRPVLFALVALGVAGRGGLLLPRGAPLRHAVRGRRATWARRGGLRRGPPRAGGAARAGARPHLRVLRPGVRTRRAQARAASSRTPSWTPPRPGSSRAGRRIAISAAGPISDFVVGGTFTLASLLSGPGTHARHRFPGRAGRLPRRALQPQPDARPRRLPHPDRRRAPAEPARAGPLWLSARLSGRRAEGHARCSSSQARLSYGPSSARCSPLR